MIYWELFTAFLQIGLFSFGGALSSIPLIRDVVLRYGWFSDEMFTYFVAVSESTPGPIMINLATYIGSLRGGLPGALLATSCVVLPSFVIVLVIITMMKNFINNPYVQAVLKGIRPSFIGMILGTGLVMILKSVFAGGMAGIAAGAPGLDGKALLMTTLLFALPYGYQRVRGKELSSILLILIAAGMGVLMYTWI